MSAARTGGAVAALLLALATAAAPWTAHAGRPCAEQRPTPDAVARGLDLALTTRRALDASGAQVVVLARAGQDLSAYGLRWSHLAFAYRVDEPGQPTAAGPSGTPASATTPGSPGTWRVLHKLNHCGTAQAALYRQGLGEFFLDAPHRFEAAYSVPTPALQARLLPLLQANASAAALNEPRYNMLAYPWAQRYQQSNQWLTETLALAAEPQVGADRGRAQAWLTLQGYQPTVLALGPMTRLGARVTAANVAFDDHPDGQRFANRIATTTADSVFDWLARSGLGSTPTLVR